MRAIKSLICWIYAIQAAFFLLVLAGIFMAGPHSHYAHGHRSLAVNAVAAGFTMAVSVIFGMAWWTVLRGKSSARFWIILPSLTYIAIGIGIVYRYPAHFVNALMPLAMGLAGPIVTWRRSSLVLPAQEAVMPKIAGDGTSNLLNKCGQIFAAAAYLAAWWGCGYWLMHSGLPRPSHGLLILFTAGFLSTLVHEIGHTIVGLAVHMRLRAFVAGPFQWRISDGKWRFRFNPAGLLTDEGATGVVPSSPHQPRLHQIVMIAAGPVTNLYCGLIALGFAYAFSTPANASPGLAYPFALFGLYGLIGFVFNLIPLRTGSNYSDGAKILQLLSNGPWADFHRAASIVTSSLVTPLHPKDYDIQTIQRASTGIAQGNVGMILRIWAYSHFLDSGRIPEAVQALEDAEQVFHASSVNMPAELYTVFVFGNAYARRDAASARRWWDAMQARKPASFNVDYYRAESALCWIEGNLAQANTAWARSNELAQQLPHAGAYEFDRTCCNLLRQAIDTTPGGQLALAPVPAAAQEQSYQWIFLSDAGTPQQPSPAVSE